MMIACLDIRDPAAVSVDLSGASDPDPSFGRDFGGIVRTNPAAVIRPRTAADVSAAVLAAARSEGVMTVAARGNGHSVHGQAMAEGGMVLDMRALDPRMELVGESALADVSAGALWEEVLTWGVVAHGLAPASWTDYLGLTVGGTLSNGGISGQAYRRGPQLSNVAEIEVVTADGERHVCSPSVESDLFFAVLGGLGQFGVITRVRIPLLPAPHMVRWMRMVYSRFEEYSADAESLVKRTEAFDYLEGFAFVNGDDPVNGWGSVPIRPGTEFNPKLVPTGSGPVLYCLEVALHYNREEDEESVGQRARGMIRDLRHVRGLEFAADVSYVGFLSRVKHAEEAARANGSWDAPHPWLNLLVSAANIVDFDRYVFKEILSDGIGGPMLVYPLLRSKWDPRTSVALPESEVFYLVALLRFARPYPEGPAAEEMLAQNQEIIDCCDARGYDYKQYIPHYRCHDEWKRHFGPLGWAKLIDRKARYDPMAILAPGQNIFSPSWLDD